MRRQRAVAFVESSTPIGADVVNILVPVLDVPDAEPADFDAILRYLNVSERVRSFRTMPYAAYLETGHWQATRRAALARASHKCQRCGSATRLNVHHLTYTRFGCEDDRDLEVLCRLCHKLEHGLES